MVISIKTGERNGRVVGAVLVNDEHEVMLITNGGTLVRTPVAGVSVMSRNTQGVGMIRLSKGERLMGIARIETLGGEDSSEDPATDSAEDAEDAEDAE